MKIECAAWRTALTDPVDGATESFDAFGEAHKVAGGKTEVLYITVREADDKTFASMLVYKYPAIAEWLYSL